MYMSKTDKIPEGITIDIDASPETPESKSLFGFDFSKSSLNDSTTNSSTEYKSSYKGLLSNYGRIGLIIVILLFLGINIFSYLGDFFQKIKDTSAPIIGDILKNMGLIVSETTKDVTKITADSAKLGVDVAAGTIESGIDVIQGQLDLEQQNNSNKNSNNNSNKNSLSASLNTALADAEYNSEPLPDDATSSTQRNRSSKSGYCYIGEDRGFRSCISVNENDTCMSGDIFPSNEICINPSLRE